MEPDISGLSLTEKIRLVSGRDMWHLEAVPAFGISSVLMTDGPHGIRRQTGPADAIGLLESAPATCFPPAVTLGSSWDIALAKEVGEAVGREARAQGVGVVLGPGLNLKRHPCCGRNFEYFSEDPLLGGMMAGAMVRGIQATGAGACIKHFAVNNQETRRMTVDAVVDERTLRELYLRGFEIAVREGRPRAVMCAYNRVNGEYCSDSRRMLTELLREEWGFDGLVMSDWGATNDRVAALAAGMDLEMPSSAGANDAVLLDAIASGRLAEEALDTAASRVVALARQVTGGPAEHDGTVDLDAHHDLARRVAAAGTVLLTNDGTLPLTVGDRIAVIGAFAAEPRYQGTGSSRVTPTRLDSALDALRTRIGTDSGNVTYAHGYESLDGSTSDDLLRAASSAAATADIAIVFVGLPDIHESEGFDREHLRLPEGHERLIESVCDANPRTVVVLSNGSAIEMPWVGRPAAILEGYLGGQAGGSAIVDVLLGDVDPGGRLAETFPLSQRDLPADENFPGTPAQVEYREALNVGYRYFARAGVPVRFPFGHGLSYTEFEIGTPVPSATHIRAGEPLRLSVDVRNTGPRSGSTVVQVYVAPRMSHVLRPARELRGFVKVHLEPGASTVAEIDLDSRAFALFDPVTAAWQTEAGEYELQVATSAEEIQGTVVVAVDSDYVPSSLPLLPDRVADDAGFEALLGHPVPQPRPARPFDRTSAVEDLVATRLGRLVRRALVSSARKQSAGGGDAQDPVTAAMLERVVEEMPLRSIVTMSQGRLTWRMLDVLVDVLNGQWGSAVRRLAGRRSRRG